jgi:hypothetical protein
VEGSDGGKNGGVMFDCFEEHRWLWKESAKDPVRSEAFIFRDKV